MMYPFKTQDLHFPNIDEVAKSKYYVKLETAVLSFTWARKTGCFLLQFESLKNKSQFILEKGGFSYLFFHKFRKWK